MVSSELEQVQASINDIFRAVGLPEDPSGLRGRTFRFYFGTPANPGLREGTIKSLSLNSSGDISLGVEVLNFDYTLSRSSVGEKWKTVDFGPQPIEGDLEVLPRS